MVWGMIVNTLYNSKLIHKYEGATVKQLEINNLVLYYKVKKPDEVKKGEIIEKARVLGGSFE